MLSLVVRSVRSGRLLLPLAYIICIILSCHYFITSVLVLTKAQSLLYQRKLATTDNLSVTSDEVQRLESTDSKNSWLRSQRSIKFPIQSNSLLQNDSWRSNSTEIWASNKDGVSLNATRFYPWIGDEDCERYFIQFVHYKSFKPRALVSFPGSGNSWLRYLIDSSSGYFTGSVYHDRKMFNSGLLGEMRLPNDGTTILQKTHHDTIYSISRRKLQAYVKLSELMFGYRGILLIRNPFDAIISYWNYKKSLDHKGFATKPDFRDREWMHFALEEIKKWAMLIKSWITNSRDLMIVQYENLKEHPLEELVRILEYLEQPIDTQRLGCVMRHLEGPFHRKKKTSSNGKFAEDSFEANSTVDNSLMTSGNDVRKSTETYTLDLIIQQHINELNIFLLENSFPLFLNYTGSTL